MSSTLPYFSIKGVEQMKKDYNDIDELIKDLEDAVEKTAPKVAKEMREYEKEAIFENVYNAYSPKKYKRRYEDGGLIADENIDLEIEKNSDGYTIIMTNTTRGNKEYGGTSGYIQDVIEEGKGYWTEYLDNVIGARPFIEPTEKKIEERLEDFIEKELADWLE